MAASLLALSLATATVADATGLPSFSAAAGAAERAAELERSGQWWAHLGDQVYHAPPESSGLSSRAADYYYAFGSEAAITEELRDRRVGGQGRLHIFHLPEGPSVMLQLASGRGSRRSSLSALSRLHQGLKVQTEFPAYAADPGYLNPLDEAGQALEATAVAGVTSDAVMGYLRHITSFNTRSYENAAASQAVQQFLLQQFEGMNYATCLHSFRSNNPGMSAESSRNVVAFVPGAANGSEVVVLGAHYDDIPPSGSAPGAEDNGSGLAALLAIMRAFRKADVQPMKSVAFVAFAAEEPGLLGSEAFVQALLSPTPKSTIPGKCLPQALLSERVDSALAFLRRQRGSRLRRAEDFQAIVMDEVGWRSPSLDEATVNLESYDWTAKVMEQLAQASKDHNGASLKVVHSNHPFGSDHMSFLNRNIPAVLTINGDDEAYPFYHTSKDEITSVDGGLVAKVAKMNLGGLLRLAGVRT
uniref:Peptidase M28 domain-containing protein n=1 Tax=Pyrodinium bahamense TaxID=73915 RepID=A0A7S0FPU4_9DINO